MYVCMCCMYWYLCSVNQQSTVHYIRVSEIIVDCIHQVKITQINLTHMQIQGG